MATQTRQARKQTLDFDVEDENQYYVTKPHTSAIRYDRPARRDTLESPIVQPGTIIQRRRSAFEPTTGSGIASKAIAPSMSKGMGYARRFPYGRRMPRGLVVTLPERARADLLRRGLSA